jgi:hypothetical protein
LQKSFGGALLLSRRFIIGFFFSRLPTPSIYGDG